MMICGKLTYHPVSKHLGWHDVRGDLCRVHSWHEAKLSSHPYLTFVQKHGATLAQLKRRLLWSVSSKQSNRWYTHLRRHKRQLGKGQTDG